MCLAGGQVRSPLHRTCFPTDHLLEPVPARDAKALATLAYLTTASSTYPAQISSYMQETRLAMLI